MQICVDMCIQIHRYIYRYRYRIFFIHSSINELSVCFHALAVVSNPVVHVVSVWLGSQINPLGDSIKTSTVV